MKFRNYFPEVPEGSAFALLPWSFGAEEEEEETVGEGDLEGAETLERA